MNYDLLLLGCGGHFESVLDSIAETGQFDKIGLVCKDACSGSVCGIEIVGSDADLEKLRRECDNAFITVGSVGNTVVREKLYKELKRLEFNVPNIIDKTAVVSRNASLGKGIFVGKRAVINYGAVIGDCCIINTASVIEHGCTVSDFAHISPGAVLCGDVKIGYGTHIGAGAVIRQGLTVGERSIIGLSGAVVSDMGDGIVAYGNPCKMAGKT